MINKIIKISANWCGPCNVLKKELATFDYVPIIEKDAEEDEEFCKEYNIKNIPTLLFFDNDNLIDKHVGLIKCDELLEKIKQLNNN